MPIKPYAGLLLLIVVAALTLFTHLDALPLQEWDESRLASNALEMSHNNNAIVTYYHGSPDMWNTKPPLMIWLQVVMIKLLGPNELAVRLPSALAALGTCLLIFFLFFIKLRDPLAGMICGILLCIIPGYVGLHGTRTGDYDSLLTMLMAAYAVSYFIYLEEGKQKYLLATFVLLIAAALTKGVESVLFLPAMLAYTVYKRKLFTVFRHRYFYIGTLCFLFFVVGYYLLREHYNPGYIQAVQQNEVGGRYNTTIEGHVGDEWYYFNWLTSTGFQDWYLLIIPGFFAGIFSKHGRLKDLTIFSAVVVLSYFLILNYGHTKVFWYTMPLFPFAAILAGLFIHSVCVLIGCLEYWKKIVSFNVFPYLFLFLVFVIPVTNIVSAALSQNDDPVFRNDRTEKGGMEQYMKDALHDRRSIDGLTFIDEGITQNIYWYYHVYQFGHRPIKMVYKEQIARGSTVVAYLDKTKGYITEHFDVEVLDTFYSVSIYKVDERK